ncbi:MAG: hypothetical protein ACTTID_03340 [Bacillales bacterium]
MKKTIKIITLIVSFSFLSSCVNKKSYQFYEVTDKNIKDAVFRYDLNYKIFIPSYFVTYSVLWKGYDVVPGPPGIKKNERYYTYLTEYESNKDSYYMLCFNKKDIEKFSNWFTEYHKNNSYDLTNYHFIDDINVIDGKYLLFGQENNILNYKVYHTSNPYDISRIDKEYIPSICLQSKELNIVENISLGYKINKKIKLFRRYELRYDLFHKNLKKYKFYTPEITNIEIIDNIFSYNGLRIETYPIDFENFDFAYCPKIGLKNEHIPYTLWVNVLNDNTIILPRYRQNSNNIIDLLDSNNDISFFDDIYYDLKEEFKDAFIKMDDKYYGIFDFNKIKNIIKDNGK